LGAGGLKAPGIEALRADIEAAKEDPSLASIGRLVPSALSSIPWIGGPKSRTAPAWTTEEGKAAYEEAIEEQEEQYARVPGPVRFGLEIAPELAIGGSAKGGLLAARLARAAARPGSVRSKGLGLVEQGLKPLAMGE